MDMPKLLIADSTDQMGQILFDDLRATYQIKCCSDGIWALELIRAFQPDILLLDLMLPGLDGLTLLHRMQDEGFHPAVLTVSVFYSDYVIGALHNLGISYMMKQPCDLQAVADRLADIAAQLSPVQLPQVDITSATASLLLALGFPTRLDGFRFLLAGIPLYLKDPSQGITKELYVAIGDACGKDSQQVERSIRSAIDTAWKKRDPKVWQQYFSAPNGQIPRPSNTEFISRMATALAYQGFSAKTA